MSYHIVIGETAIDRYGDHPLWSRFYVEELTLPEAPAFPGDIYSQHSNVRSPGYLGWGNFCRKAGVYKLFFDNDHGLMREHAGIFPLLPAHLAEITKAVQCWRRRHPRAVPGFEDGQDPILARLLWLEWWFRWALENCRLPAIYNS